MCKIVYRNYVTQLATDVLGNLGKEFPRKVLKLLSDFFLLPVVRCERKGYIEERAVQQERART